MKKNPPTRKLREHSDLDQLRRQAKELLAADPSIVALHDAQFVLARSYGFESWPKLKACVDGATVKRLAGFVQAGDEQQVRAMLKKRPELAAMAMSYSDERCPLEGWTDPGGADVVRRDLTKEAFFLARLVAELMPEPEALGLLALMLHAEARRRARRSADGEYVPFAEQDPALWDGQMIEEAEALLRRACALGAFGRYQLEAAIQSAHIDRGRSGCANWAAVVKLYDALSALTGSPVVAINRALAIAELQGARAGLSLIQEMAADVRLAEYQPYWAARAELEARSGAPSEARHAYEIAIGLERNPAVRRFLQRRQSALPA